MITDSSNLVSKISHLLIIVNKSITRTYVEMVDNTLNMLLHSTNHYYMVFSVVRSNFDLSVNDEQNHFPSTFDKR